MNCVYVAVVVAVTSSDVCFLSTARCCLCRHHYVHEHATTLQPSVAVASLAHKLVLSAVDMSPAVCGGYRCAEHVHRARTVHPAMSPTFGLQSDVLRSVLHEVQLVSVCSRGPGCRHGLGGLLREFVSAI